MNKSRLKLLIKKALDKMKRRAETRIAFPNLFLTFCIKKNDFRKEKKTSNRSKLPLKKKQNTMCLAVVLCLVA